MQAFISPVVRRSTVVASSCGTSISFLFNSRDLRRGPKGLGYTGRGGGLGGRGFSFLFFSLLGGDAVNSVISFKSAVLKIERFGEGLHSSKSVGEGVYI